VISIHSDTADSQWVQYSSIKMEIYKQLKEQQ
jgi:pentose-5-phosphate-3-epimerase